MERRFKPSATPTHPQSTESKAEGNCDQSGPKSQSKTPAAPSTSTSTTAPVSTRVFRLIALTRSPSLFCRYVGIETAFDRPLVDREQALGDVAPVVALTDDLPRGLAHRLPTRLVFQQTDNRLRQRLGVAGRHRDPGALVEDVAVAGNIRG